MKPPAFEYYAPESLDECVALLAEHADDEAKLLAGGQSLVPLLNLRMARPEVLIDLNRIPDVAYVREQDGTLEIGALTRYAEIEDSPLVRELCPVLARATAQVGYPAIRSRGTIGGSIAHADPVAEWPCLMRTLDAELVATGPAGTRTIAVADFFAGLFTTALEPTEVLTQIRIPLRRGRGASGFEEFVRKTGDYAVVAVALDLAVPNGTVADARVGFSNLADRPVRSSAVESLLTGVDVSAGAPPELKGEIETALLAEQDADAYRLRLASVLAWRAFADACAELSEATA